MTMTGKAILSAAFCGLVAVRAFAQTGVPGKAFVAEISGGVTFIVDGAMTELRKGVSLPIQGARIETAPGANVVFVFSNGTSIYVDEKTIVEILRFMQRPFPAGIDTTVIEPSVSDTLVRVTQGRVVVTTNNLATGTSMIYRTPQSQVRIRGKEVVIQVENQTTNVLLLRGDATVTARNAAPGDVGQVLRDGQMAVGTISSASSAAAATIQIETLEQTRIAALGPLIAATERAQKIVVFEAVTTGEGANAATEIRAKAVVPADLPVELTVSPSTLRTGG